MRAGRPQPFDSQRISERLHLLLPLQTCLLVCASNDVVDIGFMLRSVRKSSAHREGRDDVAQIFPCR
jgi:hypothetical protein